MAIDRSHARFWTIPALVGLGAVVAAVGDSRADRIMLRGGGQIRGKVLPDPQHGDRLSILTESGKTPLNFQKAQILQVHPEPGPLDDYLVRRDQVESTAAAQFELGLWCEQHKLKDLAAVHYEAALKLDKMFAPAHQKLGHVLYSDTWLWGDELREAQGLVRYKGQWISKQEKEHREAQEATRAEQASWVRRLKLLRQALLTGSEERRRGAESQLMEIRDPIAVAPLVQVLGEAIEPIRILLDQVLRAIDGPEAASALVMHILYETDPDVRRGTMDALTSRKDTNIVPALVQALQSKNPAIVNRAAWALGQLGEVSTVPKLIPALFTVQYRIEIPPIGGGPSGGNFGASFGSVAPAPGMGSSPYFYGGNTYGLYGMLTPPVVGPGVAAFGASAVPLPTLPNNSFSVNGGVTGTRSGPPPRIVPITYQNVEVLATLVKLTGQDFGYDIPTWKRWVASSFHPDPTPARVVPQP